MNVATMTAVAPAAADNVALPGWGRPRAWEVLWLALVTLGAAGLFVTQMDDESLWIDELIGLGTVQRPLVQSLLQEEDYSAPLYPLIVRALAQNEPYPPLWKIRGPAVLAAVLALPATWWLARMLFGPMVAACTIALMPVSPHVVRFAMEGRGYSMFLLLSVLSMALFYRALHRGGRWTLVGYVLATAGLLYAHYYGILCVMAQGVYLLLFLAFSGQPRAPAWRVAGAAVAALLLGTLPLALMLRLMFKGSPGTVGWMASISWPDIFTKPASLLGVAPLGALCVAPLIAALWPARTPWDSDSAGRIIAGDWWQRRSGAVLCAVWFAAALGTLILVSLLYRPMYHPRYALPALVPVMVAGLAFALRISRVALVAVLAGVLAMTIPTTREQLISREGMAEVTHYVRQHLKANPQSRVLVVEWAYCNDWTSPDERGLRYYGLRDVPVERISLEYPYNVAIRNPQVLESEHPLLVVSFMSAEVLEKHLAATGRRYEVQKFGLMKVFQIEPGPAPGS